MKEIINSLYEQIKNEEWYQSIGVDTNTGDILLYVKFYDPKAASLELNGYQGHNVFLKEVGEVVAVVQGCNHLQEDICTCICHKEPVMHIRACCHICEKCGKNIKE